MCVCVRNNNGGMWEGTLSAVAAVVECVTPQTLPGGVSLMSQSTPNVFFGGIEEEIPMPMLSLCAWMESDLGIRKFLFFEAN